MFLLNKNGFLAILAVLVLSGCLPDGSSTPKEAKSEQTKIQSNNFAASLSNITMQMQTSIVSDAAIYAGIKASSWEIDLGTLAFPALGAEKVIYASADDVTQTRAFLCPLNTSETQFRQIAWIDSSDDSGNFSLKGMGTETGPLLNALNAKLSSDTVGTFRDDRITLNNGQDVPIPSSCAMGLDIPNNAPVVVFNIERPAAPAQDIARTEYQTIACPTASVGSQLQSRTMTLTTKGEPEVTPWVNIGDGCATAANINADPMTQTTGQAPEVNIGGLTGNAAAGLRAALMQQLATPCVASKTKKTVTEKHNQGNTQREGASSNTSAINSSVDTCGEAQNIQVDTKEVESAGTPKSEILTTACSSSGLANSTSFDYLGFTGNIVYSSWNGTIQLRRNILVSANQNATQGDTTGAWYGETLSCNRTETLTLDCGQYYDNALNARNSGNNPLEYQGDSSPYIISRQGYINGFSNPTALLPKAPTHNNWNYVGGSCRWTEREKIIPSGCTYPNEFADEGEQVRTITVDVNGNPTYSSWTTTVTARCVAGCDAWNEQTVNVGDCKAGRNGQCTISFNLGSFVDMSFSRNVYVKWYSAYNVQQQPVFNNNGDASLQTSWGGGKGYSMVFNYSGGSKEVRLTGGSWGWKKCDECGGEVNKSSGGNVTIGSTSRVRCGTVNTCQQTPESYAGACPSGMTDVRAPICDEWATATQVDENGNSSTYTYCSKPRCLRWEEYSPGSEESSAGLTRYCAQFDRGGPPVNYSRTINLFSICGNNTDWSPDQNMINSNCAFDSCSSHDCLQ